MLTAGTEGQKIPKPPKVPLDRDPTIKAMENPISAIFDLAESVNSQVPRIKRMIQYSGVFVIVWLSVNIVFLILFLAMGQLPLFLILFVFLVLGSFGLYLMWNINQFFDYFSRRHLAIKLIRDHDELVHVPKGRDNVQSYITYLRKESTGLDQAVLRNPHMLHTPVILHGISGIAYNFDGYIYRPSSFLWRLIGIGDPGYAFYIKCYDHTPSMNEVQALERAVQDISSRSTLCPSRVVILVDKKVGALIDDEVYQHVTTRKPVIKIGFKKCVVNIQVVSVDEDNTYDFVPAIAENAQPLP